MYHPVTVVRSPGKPDEKRHEAKVGGTLDYNILFHPDVDIKRGDELHAPVLDEPRVVTDIHPQFASSGLTHYEADLVPKSEHDDEEFTAIPSVVQQTIYGNVGKLAGRDMTELNLNAIGLLDVLAKAVEESDDIPAGEKPSLLERIAELRKNPYIVGVGSGLVLKLLERLVS